MFDTLKTKWRLYRLNKRYEKLLEDAGRRYLKQKDEALAYRIEEADRKTEATLSNYHNIFKENNLSQIVTNVRWYGDINGHK